MGGRLLVGGVTGLVAPLLFATAVQWSRVPASTTPRQNAASAIAETLNNAESTLDTRGWPWVVTRATSADRVMVVDVEVRRLDDARAIADEIVAPIRQDGYDEVLIYFRNTGGGDGPAERRIQWTPDGGFVEMAIGD